MTNKVLILLIGVIDFVRVVHFEYNAVNVMSFVLVHSLSCFIREVNVGLFYDWRKHL